MGVYEIRSFNSGISPYEDKGPAGSFLKGFNLNIRKDRDSLSVNQDFIDEGQQQTHHPSGSLSPSASVSISPSASVSPSAHPGSASLSPSASRSPSASLSPSNSQSPSPSPSFADFSWFTVFKDLILFFVNSSDGYTYGFGDAGYIYRRDQDGFWMQIYHDANGKIKGAEEKPSRDGSVWMFWATDTVLMKKLLNKTGRQDWNDAIQVATNLHNASWHTMKEMQGDLLIANGSMLALVGYDDSYTDEALDLIPGNVAKTLTERNNQLIIGSYVDGDENSGVFGAVEAEIPLAFIGSDGYIFDTNNGNPAPINRIPGGGHIMPGGICNQTQDTPFFSWDLQALSWNSKQVMGNMALFGVYGNSNVFDGVYSYGRFKKDAPFALNCEYQIGLGGANDQIGAVTSVRNQILASYKFGEGGNTYLYGVRAIDLTHKASEGYYYALDFHPPAKYPIQIPVWNTVEILMAPLPSGCSVEVGYELNKDGNVHVALTANGQAAYDHVGGTKAVFRIQETAEIFNLSTFLFTHANSTPEIFKIRTFFT